MASPDQPRPCLLADLVARVAERHHLRASVFSQAPADWMALNVHPAVVTAGQVATNGLDPLALRLALMRHPYRDEATLTRDDLEGADQVLRHWRALVSQWALSPSKPMCAQYVGDFLDALDDDLDTPAALRILSALAADQVIPDGSKFEALAYADRFLGLDLAREVGR